MGESYYRGAVHDKAVLLVLGLAIGFIDYWVNIFVRIPVAELVTLIILMFSYVKPSVNQLGAILILGLMAFFTNVLAGEAIDGAIWSAKVVLLLINMVLAFNAAQRRSDYLSYFVGIAIAWASVGSYVYFDDPSLAKFMFPNMVPLSIALIVSELKDSRPVRKAGFLMVWQCAIAYLIGSRGLALLVISAIGAWLIPKRLLFYSTPTLFLLPFIVLISAFMLITSGEFEANPDLSTRSNVERTTMLIVALDHARTIPLVGASHEIFLHQVDVTLGRMTTDALSTTSAHNYYADAVIQYGLIGLAIIVVVLGNLCFWCYKSFEGATNQRLLWYCMVCLFLILSLTPVSSVSRVELIWLAYIIGFSARTNNDQARS